MTRAALKSEFEKHCGGSGKKNTLVILDSMNYIKGYRYELHCIAKAAGEKHAVIWVLLQPDIAIRWNNERRQRHNDEYAPTNHAKEDCVNDGASSGSRTNAVEGDVTYYYTEDQMKELACRYEPPDQRNRWDRPLYRVDVTSTLDAKALGDYCVPKTDDDGDDTGKAAEEVLHNSVYNFHSLSDAIRDESQSKVATSSAYSKQQRNKTASVSSSFQRRAVGGRSAGRAGGARGGFQRHIPTATTTTTTDDKQHDDAVTHHSIRSNEESDANGSINVKDESTNIAGVKGNTVKKNIEDLIDAILDSFLLDVQPLKQGMSTKLHSSASSNVLHQVDSISQQTMTAFLSAQQKTGASGGGNLKIPIGVGSDVTATGGEETYSIQSTRTIRVVEMKRWKRQYIKWVSDHPPKDTSEVGIARSFLSYVENQI